MPLNSLVGQAGLKLGPLVLETLFKHYLERIQKERGDGVTDLSQTELLYDEAFHIIKVSLDFKLDRHTIEELQEFSNTRTPTPPWTHIVRLLVPISCCDDAATYLIQALGGEEVTKRVVGGTKWWQVRGITGVDAEWLAAKKDWQEAKRRHKAHLKKSGDKDSNIGHPEGLEQAPQAIYEPEMDKMPCILFAHGGGYYFGSIDQERYSIERYARKINGRVFAINYRLAPQYPFPCALHDCLSAYLFLIRPPEGALHRPVDPAKIVVAGDSAGGGLCLALLQVIRDTGLPMPAGGVLISPWCDLTHSFPSVHVNSATVCAEHGDVLPPYGLSFHKPSMLWPPPPDEVTTQVQNSIRSRVREAFRTVSHEAGGPAHAAKEIEEHAPPSGVEHQFVVGPTGQTLHLGSTASLPTPSNVIRDQTITLRTASEEVMKIDRQIQMYAPNYLLTHPLVSSAVSYLGGLPPLLVIASDKEVLRDEIIYIAHKAAHPDKHHVKDEARKLYPLLEGIESRFGPTKVHLQVWDDAAHTLPTLFSFTTPAKYCYRAIATFCKYATGVLPPPSSSYQLGDAISINASPSESPNPSGVSALTEHALGSFSTSMPHSHSSSTLDSRPRMTRPNTSSGSSRGASRSKRSMRRAVSVSAIRAGSLFHRGRGESTQDPGAPLRETSDMSDVAGPRFGDTSTGREEGVRKAGEPSVYDNGLMIRERVTTKGVVRPLEPEEELVALQFSEELIGEISELVVRRYFDGRAKFDKKFAKVTKSIEKERRRNIDRAHNDAIRKMAHLQAHPYSEEQDADGGKGKERTPKGIQDGLINAGSWPWGWALEEDEAPPPSSIVARRDTDEARRLARIADQAFLVDENALSGNNLWSVIVEFLTKSPDKSKHGHKSGGHAHEAVSADQTDSTDLKRGSRFARFLTERRPHANKD
ncbi:candidate lipase/esterase from carbohydrate esterase family CE10 [Postia placenta Mad-698-R]|nr:candidate lipase/esterase from carbohydrate esterase family CE10 [Postia placenta Mad-698-R]